MYTASLSALPPSSIRSRQPYYYLGSKEECSTISGPVVEGTRIAASSGSDLARGASSRAIIAYDIYGHQPGYTSPRRKLSHSATTFGESQHISATSRDEDAMIAAVRKACDGASAFARPGRQLRHPWHARWSNRWPPRRATLRSRKSADVCRDGALRPRTLLICFVAIRPAFGLPVPAMGCRIDAALMVNSRRRRPRAVLPWSAGRSSCRGRSRANSIY